MLNFERLAYWYLRLNGFLTLPNVMIHPETGRNARGEIDVLGVRFPYRSELLINSMQDDPRVTTTDKPLIVLGEVKTGRADLNPSWRDPSRCNMERVLRFVGALPLQKTREAATAIYEQGCYTDANYHLTVVAFGASANSGLARDLPGVPQITWREVAAFIHGRFYQHRNAKHSHDQWDEAGQDLWMLYERHRADPDGFYVALSAACRPGSAGRNVA